MEIWFDIWVYSTDTYYTPDAASEVLLASMPVPVVAEPEWTKLKVLGLDIGSVPAKESEERNGVSVHCRTQIVNGTMVVYPLEFPDERDDLDSIYALFAKNYVYICMDGDSVEHLYPWRFHTSGSCLMIGITDLPEPEHDYENANKKLRIGFQKYLPK